MQRNNLSQVEGASVQQEGKTKTRARGCSTIALSDDLCLTSKHYLKAVGAGFARRGAYYSSPKKSLKCLTDINGRRKSLGWRRRRCNDKELGATLDWLVLWRCVQVRTRTRTGPETWLDEVFNITSDSLVTLVRLKQLSKRPWRFYKNLHKNPHPS